MDNFYTEPNMQPVVRGGKYNMTFYSDKEQAATIAQKAKDGDWTTENSLERLYMYFKEKGVKEEFTVKAITIGYELNYEARLGFWLNSIGKEVHAKELGKSQEEAVRKCAYTVVLKMYHLNAIEAYSVQKPNVSMQQDYHFTSQGDKTMDVLNYESNKFSYEPGNLPDSFSQISTLPQVSYMRYSNYSGNNQNYFGSTEQASTAEGLYGQNQPEEEYPAFLPPTNTSQRFEMYSSGILETSFHKSYGVQSATSLIFKPEKDKYHPNNRNSKNIDVSLYEGYSLHAGTSLISKPEQDKYYPIKRISESSHIQKDKPSQKGPSMNFMETLFEKGVENTKTSSKRKRSMMGKSKAYNTAEDNIPKIDTIETEELSSKIKKPIEVTINEATVKIGRNIEVQLESVLKSAKVSPVVPLEGVGINRLSLIPSFETEMEDDDDELKRWPSVQYGGNNNYVIVEDDVDECNGNITRMWQPPLPNWHAFKNLYLDSHDAMDRISYLLKSNSLNQFKNDRIMQDIQNECRKLPIHHYKWEITSAVVSHSVVIICGVSGCGKSTQVCQYILDDYIKCGKAANCNIIVSEPHPLSAVTHANRVSHERGERLQESVGYCTKFEWLPPRPYAGIQFCSVDSLIRRLDTGLKGISHVIIDEVQESDMETHFLLFILSDMIKINTEMRIILLSASIDLSYFEPLFKEAKIIDIRVNTNPVKEYFLEDFIEASGFSLNKKMIKKNLEDESEINYSNLNVLKDDKYSETTKSVMALISEKEVCFEVIFGILKYIHEMTIKGNILLILPCSNVAQSLLQRLQRHDVFGSNLYSLVPFNEGSSSDEVSSYFRRNIVGQIKIILATSIAESCFYANNVSIVIDSCRCRRKHYPSHNNIMNKETVWASKYNLEHRSKLAGQSKNGMCFYLCSKERFTALEDKLTPEINYSPLEEFALLVQQYNLGKITSYFSKFSVINEFIVAAAENTLKALNCIDNNGKMTSLGRIICKFPVHPRLAKMILTACLFLCGDALCTIVAIITTSPQIYSTSYDKKLLLSDTRNYAGDRISDYLSMLNLYRMWETKMENKRADVFSKFIGFSYPHLMAIHSVKKYLKNILRNCGLPQKCYIPSRLNFYGPDSKLDIIQALLCYAHYPNFCHRIPRSRQVYLTDYTPALIHSSSYICSEQSEDLLLYVYGEKICTRNTSVRYLNLITPVHIMLFGCQKIEYIGEEVQLDDWLSIKMSGSVAAKVCALRNTIDKMLFYLAQYPAKLLTPSIKYNGRVVPGWWTKECIEAIKTKKKADRIWLKSRMSEDYIMYKKANKAARVIIRAAREKGDINRYENIKFGENPSVWSKILKCIRTLCSLNVSELDRYTYSMESLQKRAKEKRQQLVLLNTFHNKNAGAVSDSDGYSDYSEMSADEQ